MEERRRSEEKEAPPFVADACQNQNDNFIGSERDNQTLDHKEQGEDSRDRRSPSPGWFSSARLDAWSSLFFCVTGPATDL